MTDESDMEARFFASLRMTEEGKVETKEKANGAKTLTIRLDADDMERIKTLQGEGRCGNTINGALKFGLLQAGKYVELRDFVAGILTKKEEIVIAEKNMEELREKVGKRFGYGFGG